MTSTAWLDDIGLVTLPSGLRVRGRRQGDTVSPADFALLLADGPVPAWAHRHIHWPDFWIPINRADAIEARGHLDPGQLRPQRGGNPVATAMASHSPLTNIQNSFRLVPGT